MQFYARKRRQPPAVIIVALVDILIVLLIYLMVTTTFKQQPAVKIALPESSQGKKSGADEHAPLIISVDPSGNLRLGPQGRALTAEELKTELAAAAAKDPHLKIAISADTRAPFGRVLKVMDAAKAANIKAVDAFTKEGVKQ